MSGNKRIYRPGHEIVPGYTLLRRLGAGFSGQVWVARAAGGTEVALKVVELHKIGGRKELKALRTIRNVRHPNLCPVHSFWVKDSSGRLLQDGETESLDPDQSNFDLKAPGKAAAKEDAHEDPHDAPAGGGDDSSDLPLSMTGTMAFNLEDDPSPGTVDSSGDASDEETPSIFDTVVTDTGSMDGSHKLPTQTSQTADGKASAEELIIVMGLGDRTLHDRLQEVRKENDLSPEANTICGLDAAESIRYLRSSAKAIDALMQQHDILHGDIKPQNILLVGGEAQVCDFGLANKIDGDIRFTGQTFASPAYGAPEVLDGQTYSKSADQYSLAVTYFELRTGLLPFNATTALKILTQKAAETFDLEFLPAAQRKVLRRAMRSDPSKRYGSCTEFVNELALAAGIDKTGGLQPLKVALGGVVLAGVIGVGVYSVVPDSGKAASELLAEADLEWAKYQPQQKYGDARYLLKKSFDKLAEGFVNASQEERPGFYAKASESADALSNELLEELSAPKLDETGQPAQAARIAEDLKLLTFHQSDSSDALLPSSIEANVPIGQKLDLARLQLSILSSDSSLKADDETIARIRSEVQSSSSSNDATILKSTALAMALTHQVEAASSDHYLLDERLTDIAAAQTQLLNDANIVVPSWMVSRWNRLRDGEDGFLRQIQNAISNKEIDPSRLALIESTWPELSIEAGLSELSQLAVSGQWREFVTLVKSVAADSAKTVETNPALAIKLGGFSVMADSLASETKPAASAANRIGRLSERLRNGDSALRTYMKQPVAAWLAELSGRLLRRPSLPSVDEAGTLHDAVLDLAEAGQVSVPTQHDQLMTASAIQAGPSVTGDALVEDSLARLGNRDPLVLMFTNERDAIAGKRRGSLPGKRILQTLKELEPVMALPASLRSPYREYQFALANWHASENLAMRENLAQIQKQTTDSRDVLGAVRCDWIASALVAGTLESVGAGSDRFYLSDFKGIPAAKPILDQAEWWSPSATRNEDLDASLEILDLCILAGNPSSGEKSASADPVSESLRERVGVLVKASSPMSSADRLLARLAFDASWQQFSLETNPSIEVLQNAAATMLDTSTLMLREGVGRRNPSGDWITKIIAPTVVAVQTYVSRTGNGWTLARPLRRPSLGLFGEFALKAEGTGQLQLSMNRAANRLAVKEGNSPAKFNPIDAVEFYHYVSAKNPEHAASTRYGSWIRASELFQDHMDNDKLRWDATNLARFQSYVTQARALVESGQVDQTTAQVDILDAMGNYHNARTRWSDEGASQDQLRRKDRMSGAAQKIGDAIAKAAGEPASAAYFNACWRHANALVNLANSQSGDQRHESLTLARKSANQAIEMIDKLPRDERVVTNSAYLTLGNACEDMGHYFFDDPVYGVDANARFNEAIDSFKSAQSKTWMQSSVLKPRYSLARCRLRYYVSGLGGRNQLETALKDLGEFSSRASVHAQVEWLSWRSQIQFQLGDWQNSIDDAKRAFDVLAQAEVSEVDQVQKHETTYLLAAAQCWPADPRDATQVRKAKEDRIKALKLLSDAKPAERSATFWKMFVLRTQTIDSIGKDSILGDAVLQVEPDTLVWHLEHAGAKALEEIVNVVFMLRRAGFPSRVDGTPGLSTDLAVDALKRIDLAIERAAGLGEQEKPSREMIRVCLKSLADDPLTDRLSGFLDFLGSADADEVGRVARDEMRLAALAQVEQLYPSLRSPDRAKQTAAMQAIKQIPSEDRSQTTREIESMEELTPGPYALDSLAEVFSL